MSNLSVPVLERNLFCRIAARNKVTHRILPITNSHGSCAFKLNLSLRFSFGFTLKGRGW